MTDAEIVAAARACVGARFRLHGRSVARGLDCVGVVALAYGLAGVPAGYAMRGGDRQAIVAAIEAHRLHATTNDRPGDLLLLGAGPFQHHLAVRTSGGFVHADAGLRRVVETPGEPCWPLFGRWHRGD